MLKLILNYLPYLFVSIFLSTTSLAQIDLDVQEDGYRFEVALLASNYKYSEGDIMNMTGTMYGFKTMFISPTYAHSFFASLDFT